MWQQAESGFPGFIGFEKIPFFLNLTLPGGFTA